MITCSKCNFIVNGNLKYCIESNVCPTCGSKLLTNAELKEVNSIQGELVQNGFALDAHNLRMLSIFILNKLKASSKAVEEDVHLEQDSEVKSLEDETFSEETTSPSDYHAKIRDEIEEDLGISKDFLDSNDSLDKVSRLRELARTNPVLNKRGTSVRRVGD